MEQTLKAKDLILDNSIVAIVLVIQNEIQWCNHYCEFLFGFKEDELQGIRISKLLKDDSAYDELSVSVMEQIKVKGIYVEEVQFKRKTGESFWGLVNAKSVSDETFRQGILFIVSDISKLKTIQFELELLNEKLIHISQTDELTQVANRRAINECLLREHNRLERYHQSYCIILMDIDYFKLINDSFGHNQGDEVLTRISSLLKDELRSVDEVGRWGGEEFMIICPFTNNEQATHIAHTLRQKIKKHALIDHHVVTASFGVYEPRAKDNINHILDCVDRALYKAKETRDAVVNGNAWLDK